MIGSFMLWLELHRIVAHSSTLDKGVAIQWLADHVIQARLQWVCMINDMYYFILIKFLSIKIWYRGVFKKINKEKPTIRTINLMSLSSERRKSLARCKIFIRTEDRRELRKKFFVRLHEHSKNVNFFLLLKFIDRNHKKLNFLGIMLLVYLWNLLFE